MSKHTPGPWEVEPRTEFDEPWDTTDITAEGFVIACAVYSPEIYDKYYCDDELYLPVVAANARLIAAAPDLLEALKEAANWMEAELKNIGGCDHSVGICCCGDYSMLESFRAAIAKAES